MTSYLSFHILQLGFGTWIPEISSTVISGTVVVTDVFAWLSWLLCPPVRSRKQYNVPHLHPNGHKIIIISLYFISAAPSIKMSYIHD